MEDSWFTLSFSKKEKKEMTRKNTFFYFNFFKKGFDNIVKYLNPIGPYQLISKPSNLTFILLLNSSFGLLPDINKKILFLVKELFLQRIEFCSCGSRGDESPFYFDDYNGRGRGIGLA